MTNKSFKSKSINYFFDLVFSRFIWILIFGFWISAAAASNLSEITKIEAVRNLNIDYININGSGNLEGQGLLLEDQLIIEFPNTKITPGLKPKLWSHKRIKGIAAKQSGKTAKIIISLKKDSVYEVVNIFGRGKTSVELYDRENPSKELQAAWETKMLKQKTDAFKPYKYLPNYKSKDKSLRGKTIVIDPGHGGRDPGGFSLHKIPEKNLTLPLARKVANYLQAAGATVYLTRNDDRTNSLRDIVKFANKVQADIFISIHYNVFYNQRVRGTETYYYNRKSRRLGLTIHRSLVRGLKRKDRGLRRAMFYTIHHAKMPAILIEPLFISNSEEEKLARSSAFQNKTANAIAWGVKSYF